MLLYMESPLGNTDMPNRSVSHFLKQEKALKTIWCIYNSKNLA